MIALLTAYPAWAECIFHEKYLHWVGSADTEDRALDLAVMGNCAHAADRYRGLKVICITELSAGRATVAHSIPMGLRIAKECLDRRQLNCGSDTNWP